MDHTDEEDQPTFDAITATSKLFMEACAVRLKKPNWSAYLRSHLILPEEHKFITTYENAQNKEERSVILKENMENGHAVHTIVNLTINVAKEQSVRYLLTLLNDMLQEEKSRVEMFHEIARQENKSAYAWFIGLLQRQDSFIVNQTSCIISKLAVVCSPLSYMDGCELHYYFSFLKDQLRTRNDYVNTAARCLQMMLKVYEYREPFAAANGIQTILSALTRKANFQLQYQLIFALWCLTFTPTIAVKTVSLGVIHVLGELLSENSKEKVIRIILATFSNILKKVEDRKTKWTAALQMVQCKTLKTLELMETKKSDDPELQEDIQFLNEELHLSVHDLSSFDEYYSEIHSGRLHWSPVHKSDQFWRENASRLNENNFELVKILIRLLEHNENSLIVCVAAHDIGEYVRYYPRGKIVVEQLQGKQAVMKLLTATDPNVRYHALLAVQKLLVQNWEYLGRQVNTENE